MDIRDSQRIKEIRDNTRAMAEAFSSIANTLADALELYISTRTETQTETQNSNLTFEKRTMRDCYNCKRYETEGECVECHYEPKDECAKEYEELGLKELKELIEADRKTESNSEKPNNCEHITEDGVTCAKYPACEDCLDNPLNKVKGSERLLKGKTEPTISKMEQVDKDINVRSKDEPQTDCPFRYGYSL